MTRLAGEALVRSPACRCAQHPLGLVRHRPARLGTCRARALADKRRRARVGRASRARAPHRRRQSRRRARSGPSARAERQANHVRAPRVSRHRLARPITLSRARCGWRRRGPVFSRPLSAPFGRSCAPPSPTRKPPPHDATTQAEAIDRAEFRDGAHEWDLGAAADAVVRHASCARGRLAQVVTFDEFGASGHADHRATHRSAFPPHRATPQSSLTVDAPLPLHAHLHAQPHCLADWLVPAGTGWY